MACAAAYLVQHLDPGMQKVLASYLKQVESRHLVAIHYRQGDKSMSKHLTDAERSGVPEREHYFENDNRDALAPEKLNICIHNALSRLGKSFQNTTFLLASDTSEGRQKLRDALGSQANIISQKEEPKHVGIISTLQTNNDDKIHSAMMSTIIDWYLFALGDVQIRISESSFSTSASLLGNGELITCN
jgi:hypothetical protein